MRISTQRYVANVRAAATRLLAQRDAAGREVQDPEGRLSIGQRREQRRFRRAKGKRHARGNGRNRQQHASDQQKRLPCLRVAPQPCHSAKRWRLRLLPAARHTQEDQIRKRGFERNVRRRDATRKRRQTRLASCAI